MTYKEATQYLFSQIPAFERQGASGYKPGLGTAIALDNWLGNPHRDYPCIHIAGTNGKGSVSHTLASILQSAGLRVRALIMEMSTATAIVSPNWV